MRISDWSSDVCSSDLSRPRAPVDNFSHLTPVQSADCRKQSHPPQFRSIAHPQAIGSQSRPQQPGLARCWTCRKSASDPLRTGSVAGPYRPWEKTHGEARDRSPWGHAMMILASSDIPSSRSEEHTSELQSLMRISYAVFCLKTKK